MDPSASGVTVDIILPQLDSKLADIIASGDIDRSVVPPPSSSHPFGAASVCSLWHLITERREAGGGPSAVNEIVTVK